MVRISKDPENIYKDVKCPDCRSPSFRRQVKSSVFVCMHCGRLYEIETLNTNPSN